MSDEQMSGIVERINRLEKGNRRLNRSAFVAGVLLCGAVVALGFWVHARQIELEDLVDRQLMRVARTGVDSVGVFITNDNGLDLGTSTASFAIKNGYLRISYRLAGGMVFEELQEPMWMEVGPGRVTFSYGDTVPAAVLLLEDFWAAHYLPNPDVVGWDNIPWVGKDWTREELESNMWEYWGGGRAVLLFRDEDDNWYVPWRK